MTEMVERVGEALFQCIRDAGSPTCEELAKVAIAAMREPTVAMYEASRFPNAGCIGDQWRVMIDTALGDRR